MDRTYRIVLVEDEPIIMNNVAKKLNAAETGFKVVGMAYNGVEALDVIERTQPDVLITDIQIPKMDGLTLLREVSQRYPETLRVILSNYSDFEYAKEAIGYGVTEYMLKTQSPLEVSRLLVKLRAKLEQRDYAAIGQHIADTLLRQQAQGSKPDALGWAQAIPFQLYFAHFGNLTIRHASPDMVSFYQYLLTMKAVNTALARHLSDEKRWWLYDMPGFFGMCLALRADGDASGLSPTELLEDLKALCRGQSVNLYGFEEPCALSELSSRVFELTQCCEDTRIAGESGISLLGASSGPRRPREAHALSRIQPVFLSQNQQELRERVQSLVDHWLLMRYPQCVLEKLISQFIDYANRQKNSVSPEEATHNEYALIAGLCRGEGFQALADRLFWLAEGALFDSGELYVDDVQTVVRRVEKYIQANYAQPNLMDEILRDCHYTPSYLSKAFKKQLNVPPLRYIIHLRVGKAKQFIAAHPEMSFKSIGEAVGYPDQSYFSRIFKNVAGMSLSEYAAAVSRCSVHGEQDDGLVL